MIRTLKGILVNNKLWFIVILILNIIFAVLLWLSNTEVFLYIFPTMIIGSLILYCATGFIIYKSNVEREEALSRFLNNPTIAKENEIINLFYNDEVSLIRNLGEILRANQSTINSNKQDFYEYEEYVEAWAHEIKNPLGLMTFILDNRKDEISPTVYKKLQYVRTKIQEDIERFLYYARLKSACNDYLFKELNLQECCEEIIEEYTVILQEKEINVILTINNSKVISDKRGLQFIIRQVISNAIKYTDCEEIKPIIAITSEESDKNIKLKIRDNGIGVKSYDLPFIFDKGFTGEIGQQRRNSTGMGLYLAKQVSNNLKIKIATNEKCTNGLEFILIFPKITI